MSPILLTGIQLVVVLGLAPLSVGTVDLFKARLEGRRGSVPWWPYWTLVALLKKDIIIPTVASWMFRATPYVVLGSMLILALALPLVSVGGALRDVSNFFVMTGVLMMGSAFFVMGALDTGSAIGGMGASRTLTIAALLEPTIILTFATLALATGSSAIDGMITGTASQGALLISAPYLLLSVLALLLVAVAETARYPIDNPATLEELTMIQGAMLQEYSGAYLAMLKYAGMLRLTVFALLAMNVILPWPLVLVTSSVGNVLSVLGVTLLKLVVAMLAIALLESTIAKMRFYRVQEFLTGTFFLSLTGLALALLSQWL